MAKNKKAQEKLRAYYRGPLKKPTRVADEQDMRIICEALVECVPLKSDHAFKCNWKGRQIDVKLIVGLSSGLRHLRHQRTLALILDDTASEHLSNLLIEYANKLEIPIVKAHRLIDLAPRLKLKTLLLLSLIEVSKETVVSHNEREPRPKPVKCILEIKSFQHFAALLQGATVSCEARDFTNTDKYSFKPAEVVYVKSTGKSKAKKVGKKAEKKSNCGKKNS